MRAFILSRSRLGSLHIIFRAFVPELWPLIYANLLFPLNRTEFHLILKCIHIDIIYLSIVKRHFSHMCTSVMALDLRQKFVSVQYLKWTEFYQILYIHSY